MEDVENLSIDTIKLDKECTQLEEEVAQDKGDEEKK